jgi:hypothetical protein
MRGVQATVTVAGSGNLDEAWQELDGPGRPTLRLLRAETDPAD